MQKARKALALSEVPVGCIIVRRAAQGEDGEVGEDEILATGHNLTNALRNVIPPPPNQTAPHLHQDCLFCLSPLINLMIRQRSTQK